MELLVCVKQVPDDSVAVKLGADGKPDLAGITPVANAFDTYALEMATRFKEENGGTVTVVTVGETEAVTNTLRSCLSVGADSVYAVNAAEDVCVNACLAKASEKLGKFDVIFIGSESTDKASMEVGARVANKLGLPLVINVLGLTPSGAGLTVKQETEEGYRLIDVPVPCVVTVVKPDYEPRYPSIKSKMAARKMPIGELTADDLEGVKECCCGKKTETIAIKAPAKREAGVMVKEKEAEDAVARAIEMLAERKLV